MSRCDACFGKGTGFARIPYTEDGWEPADCPACDGSGQQEDDGDPDAVTLTYMPRTGRSGTAVGWLLLGLAVGIMAGWTLFL